MGRAKNKKEDKPNIVPASPDRIFLLKGYKPEVVDEGLAELLSIIARAEKGQATADEFNRLRETINTTAFIQAEIKAKNATIKRLRDIIFGSKTEKMSRVCPSGKKDSDTPSNPEGPIENKEDKGESAGEPTESSTPDKRKGGKGRRPASSLPASEVIRIPHPSLKPGDPCPECPKGRVYPWQPRVLVRIVATSPIFVTRTELEKLRCNSCGEIFTANAPKGLKEEKYDESVSSLIAMLRYGTGLPLYRFNNFLSAFGMEMPLGTQWHLLDTSYNLVAPVFEHLKDVAAQGDVIYQDDTMMRLLKRNDLVKPDPERKAIYTTGILSHVGQHRVALFLTGYQHAGENLSDLLKRRSDDLGFPIQMCDALSANTKGDLPTILAHCLVHARRNFVGIIDGFPEECVKVLEVFKKIYKHEANTQGMSKQERLVYHQAHSGPLMEGLKTWFETQINERKVEPNSGLGKAIVYMQNHWDPLTLFLREPGAPLDNNVAERTLKRAILHRKNSLFYKTKHGAEVGDLFMSLIHTAELNNADPFHYLCELQYNRALVEENPEEWMPWNYRQTLAEIASAY